MIRLPTIASYLLVAAALAAPYRLLAQRIDSLSIPREAFLRVRLTEGMPRTLHGRYVGSDSIGLLIEPRHSPSVVARWETISTVDIQRRRPASEAFGRGARVGAIISGTMAVVAVTAALSYDLRGDCADCMIPASVFVIPASFAFTVAGTMVGGMIAIPLDHRWERVWPVPR